ncbi:MAG: DUF445 domain-containing protein [bacterium]|nr:DUF445 domain-containing protein [bacterium]
MNKSFLTNMIAILVIIIGYCLNSGKEQVLSVGFFAFSGAITNWLAVYMLFEKVPLLYGSGVIPNRFEEFKEGIKSLIMNQFFNKENIDRFFKQEEETIIDKLNFDGVIKAIDYNKLFLGLVDTVMSSSFGGMLGMLGGKEALTPMKEPFIKKMEELISDITKEEKFLAVLNQNILTSHEQDNIASKLEDVIDQRLAELTPQMVKEIIQEMIHKHLGWLVVWGGVFGGAIGLIMSFLN